MNPVEVETLQNFRLAVFVFVIGAMFVWETFRPVRAWLDSRTRRWLFHISFSVFNTVLTRLLVGLPLVFLIQLVNSHSWGLSHVLRLSGIGEIAATLIVFDGFDYWWHRFNHRIPFLWRFHRAHHTDTHVDVTTALRFHPGELLLSYGAKSLWILLWGPSIAGFMIFEAGITAYAQWHHSNIDFPDLVERKLRWIHMTPRLHAGHHTVSLRTRDANFSTIFLVWDRLFGTLREVDFEEMKELGLEQGRKTHLSPREFLTVPFHREISSL